MERWRGVLRVSIDPNAEFCFKVGASLCLSPSCNTQSVPSVNAVFFNGDRVQGTGNPVIEKLSDVQNIADIVVSKLGSRVNAWVVESSTFNGPFAVYKEFIPSINSRGEPKFYDPDGFPASSSSVSLLSRCIEEAKNMISRNQERCSQSMHFEPSGSRSSPPKTIILGFSKGGTVVNQILSELAHSKPQSAEADNVSEQDHIFPLSVPTFLNSISDIHFVDVGLNSAGAYLTNRTVIRNIAQRLSLGSVKLRIVLHGTPRQWCDKNRTWIRTEKDTLLHLLEEVAHTSSGKLEVQERFYFKDSLPNLQMHFEVIEELDMS